MRAPLVRFLNRFHRVRFEIASIRRRRICIRVYGIFQISRPNFRPGLSLREPASRIPRRQSQSGPRHLRRRHQPRLPVANHRQWQSSGNRARVDGDS